MDGHSQRCLLKHQDFQSLYSGPWYQLSIIDTRDTKDEDDDDDDVDVNGSSKSN